MKKALVAGLLVVTVFLTLSSILVADAYDLVNLGASNNSNLNVVISAGVGGITEDVTIRITYDLEVDIGDYEGIIDLTGTVEADIEGDAENVVLLDIAFDSELLTEGIGQEDNIPSPTPDDLPSPSDPDILDDTTPYVPPEPYVPDPSDGHPSYPDDN